MNTQSIAELEEGQLWTRFSAVATDSQRVLVRSLVRHASPLLDRIVDTFPTYTLHNERHALNVVRLMGELLGPSVNQLSALECAILILSAYYHDIGMLYSADELSTLDKQPWFALFLKSHPEAYIRYREDGNTVADYLAEWYCRWRHADRVFTYLNEIPDDELLWGVVSLRDALGEVCRSHNLGAKALQDDSVFATDFLGVCDLRLCAILLRLADLLDFDRTRSPNAVFSHLKLQTGTTEKLRASRTEWSKHLASDGFLFPAARPTDYPITLIAAPDEPSVEHDIREFIDDVELEFKDCRTIRRSCSVRWRDLPLPEAVNRTQIKPQGYAYGNYRFELDRAQVLRLFMGENLYKSSYAFIRELLQNSIDASRHREYHERSTGNPDFTVQPIKMTDWRDKEGRRWIRIDDFGMGMDEEIVQKYFLAVGNSYYRSVEFRAAMLRYGQSKNGQFQPISRFGIGLLSCFLMADLVEVSTRHVSSDANVSPALRLSLNGMEAYYSVQEEPLRARPMPAPDGVEAGYRSDIGTSIALRIDAEKEELFDLSGLVERYIIAPPVEVIVNGKPVGGDAAQLYEKPWSDTSIFVPLLPYGKVATGCEAFTADPGGAALKIIPLDLTAVSPDPRFRGQMLLVCVKGYRAAGKTYFYNVRLRNGGIEIPAEALHPDPRPQEQRIPGEPLRLLIEVPPSVWPRDRAPGNMPEAISISHNGIRVPMSVTLRGEEDGQAIDASISLTPASCFCEDDKWAIAVDRQAKSSYLDPRSAEEISGPAKQQWQEFLRNARPERSYDRGVGVSPGLSWTISLRVGALELKDDLQPIFSASRDVISGWKWNVVSIIFLAFGRALINSGDELAAAVADLGMHLFSGEYGQGIVEDFSMSAVLADPLVTSEDGWRVLPFIHVYDEPPFIGPENSYVPGSTRRSLADLLPHIADATADSGRRLWVRVLALESAKGTGFELLSRSFDQLVSSALLQSSVRLGFDPAAVQAGSNMGGDAMITYEILGIRERELEEGLLDYPPVAFVEYPDERFMRAGKAGLNSKHPVSRWLIDATPALRHSKRGVFTSLWQEITKDSDELFGSRLDEMIENVNYLLHSLRLEGFAAAPPAGLSLRRDDFRFSAMGEPSAGQPD